MKLILLYLLLSLPLSMKSADISNGQVDLSGTCEIASCGDNEFVLYLNGQQIAEGKKWNSLQINTVSLKAGDILAAKVKDKEGGKSGGFFFAIRKDGKIISDVSIFKYTDWPPSDWLTSSSMDGFQQPKIERHIGQTMGGIRNPKYAWGGKRVDTYYFKFVVPKAEQGAAANP